MTDIIGRRIVAPGMIGGYLAVLSPRHANLIALAALAVSGAPAWAQSAPTGLPTFGNAPIGYFVKPPGDTTAAANPKTGGKTGTEQAFTAGSGYYYAYLCYGGTSPNTTTPAMAIVNTDGSTVLLNGNVVTVISPLLTLICGSGRKYAISSPDGSAVTGLSYYTNAPSSPLTP